MAETIFEMRRHHGDVRTQQQSIQIMIPVNLRNRFASKTLRNFSLYALPCVTPHQAELPFEELIDHIAVQLKEQFSEEHLAAMMTTNVKLQKIPFFQFIPLRIKNLLLRVGFHFCGERNSCLTLSNLGEITYPPEMKRCIQQIDFALTPRRNAPYNCGIVSCNGKLAINFSKKNSEGKVYEYFSQYLSELGYQAELNNNGQ